MIIKDTNGKYRLQVDKKRRIIHETVSGVMMKEDFENFRNDYKNKVFTYLGAGNWAKLIDMRNNVPNTHVTPEMINAYTKWAVENGFKCAAVLVASATLKMQLNRGGKDSGLSMKYFDDEKEADGWLMQQGF